MTRSIDVKTRQKYWIAHVQSWQQSGLTRAAYCHQHGLVKHQLNYWVKRSKALDSRTVTLVPVKVVAPLEEGEIQLRSPTGWQLVLPGQTPSHWLAQLLQQLP